MKQTLLALALAGVVGQAGACGNWVMWQVDPQTKYKQILSGHEALKDCEIAMLPKKATKKEPWLNDPLVGFLICLPEGVKP